MGDLWIVLAGSACVAAFALQVHALWRRGAEPRPRAVDARTGAPLVLRLDRRRARERSGRRLRDA